ncbi:hypothetical protein D1G19_15455, partial [Staphylococcus aureus]
MREEREGGEREKGRGGGQKAASGGNKGEVLATEKKTVGMGDAGKKDAIQGEKGPNPDEEGNSWETGEREK